jgi:hypothetical protein
MDMHSAPILSVNAGWLVHMVFKSNVREVRCVLLVPWEIQGADRFPIDWPAIYELPKIIDNWLSQVLGVKGSLDHCPKIPTAR